VSRSNVAELRVAAKRTQIAWDDAKLRVLVAAEEWSLAESSELHKRERPRALRELKNAARKLREVQQAHHQAMDAWYAAWTAAGCPQSETIQRSNVS
jgi:hypothetical protein